MQKNRKEKKMDYDGKGCFGHVSEFVTGQQILDLCELGLMTEEFSLAQVVLQAVQDFIDCKREETLND